MQRPGLPHCNLPGRSAAEAVPAYTIMANVLHWTSHQQMAERHRMTKSAAARAGRGGYGDSIPPTDQQVDRPATRQLDLLGMRTDNPQSGLAKLTFGSITSGQGQWGGVMALIPAILPKQISFVIISRDMARENEVLAKG